MTFEKYNSIDVYNDYEELDEWADNLAEQLRTTTIEIDGGNHLLNLQWDSIEDDLEIEVLPSGAVSITLKERLHKTTDSRDINIKFIKKFVEQEMPYLKFTKKSEKNHGQYGFTLIFSEKGVN